MWPAMEVVEKKKKSYFTMYIFLLQCIYGPPCTQFVVLVLRGMVTIVWFDLLSTIFSLYSTKL